MRVKDTDCSANNSLSLQELWRHCSKLAIMKVTLLRRVLLLPLIAFFGIGIAVAQSNRSETSSADLKGQSSYQRLLRKAESFRKTNIGKADSLRALLINKLSNKSRADQIRTLLFSAELNTIMGRPELLREDVVQMQLLLKKKIDLQFLHVMYRYMGYYYSLSNQTKLAKEYLHAAEKISRKKRNNAQLAESYMFLALHFMRHNEQDSAIFYADEAVRFGKRTSEKVSLAKCFNTQAVVYRYFNQMESAFAKNILAVNIMSMQSDLFLLAKVYRELAEAQLSIYNLKDAEKYYNKSLEHARTLNDYRQIGLAFNGLGMVQYNRKKYSEAITYIKKGIALFSRIHNSDGLGDGYNALGIVYREQNDYSKAASCFNQALIQFESTGQRDKIAEVYHNVGTIFQKQGKHASALNYLQRSLTIRKKQGSNSQIFTTYRVMASVYQDMGKRNEALKYYTLYIDYMDSSSNISAANKIAELNEMYQSDQREAVIALQADSIDRAKQERALTNAKLENSQLRNNLQMYVIIAFVLFIILAGIIGFYRWNQTQIIQQQREAEMSQTLLRSQMNPHFVFNAMSVIQSYIYENDTVNSSRFLVNFARLMRLILENSPKEFIFLQTEVEILQKYLETQKLRFGERFDFLIEVAENLDVDSALIPPMITQPFIENAIEHGQLHTVDGGFIRVCFQAEHGMLTIGIEDNGIGRKGSEMNKKSKEHKSMAMDITRSRIDILNKKYRTDGFLRIEDYNKTLETGTKVLISLPYREEKP
jgi:tetratricopeptide (TPR) repeat protein